MAPSLCGDGVVNPEFESCDDGNSDNSDACKNDCTPNTCGDGIVGLDEQCDDGNSVSADGCSSTCETETPPAPVCGNAVNTDACKDNCSHNVCGDQVLNVGVEQCDDGNVTNGDGCDSACVVEVVEPLCGDGIVNGTEECDDGNNEDTDACMNNCTLPVALTASATTGSSDDTTGSPQGTTGTAPAGGGGCSLVI